MDQKAKTYCCAAFVVILAIFAISALWYAQTYSRSIEPSTFRSFTVSGEGEVVSIPDVATFSFTVLTQGGVNLADLQKENANKTNNAIAFVKSKGVKEKDIKTQSYNVAPRYEHVDCRPSVLGGSVSCPPPEIVGYEISQSTEVKVRDFDIIGELLAGVVESGANSVSQLSFTIDDPASIENEARAKAIEHAKEKARAIADAGDFRIGRLLAIHEGSATPIFRAKSFGLEAVSEAAFAPTIEPGSQETAITVTLTYEIR